MPALYVYDAEAAGGKPCTVGHEDTLVIWPSVGLDACHGLQKLAINVPDKSCYPTQAVPYARD